MRYYRIVITDTETKKVLRDYNSYLGSVSDPGALNVELDISVAPYSIPYGSSWVRVWGISLQDISQAADLNPSAKGVGKRIEVYGGMQKGLPLANPKQSGLLASGIVQQAFGNWIGTSMTMDLIISAGPNSQLPSNITVNWKAGTTLVEVIKRTLQTAFPGYAQTINISPDLVLSHDEAGFYGTLGQLAAYLKGISARILGGTYQGVEIVVKDKSFVVYDGTSKTKPFPIQFTDLIGQATWIASQEVQLNCVMRADLNVGDYITMPPGQAINTAQSFSQFRQKSAFQGTFMIRAMRHVGNFRYPEGEAWITTLNCNAQTPNV